MFVVGLTGGIGSGKSAVSDRFAALGVTVVDADIAARVVVEPGTTALREIAAHFGADMITADGALDRAALRRKVFDNEAERKWLERLLHPLIADEIQRGLGNAQGDYAIFVSPLLMETQQHLLADRILVVDVPEEMQLQRTMLRDKNDAAQVKAIMAAQATRAQRLASADDVIENSGDLAALAGQVEQLHRCYLQYAREKREKGGK